MLGIVFIRKLWDLTENEVADKLGVKRSSLATWERKKQVPSKRLDALSEVFDGIDRNYFQKELTELDKLNIHHFKTMGSLIRAEAEYVKNTPEEFQDQIDYFYNAKREQEHIYSVGRFLYELMKELSPKTYTNMLDVQENRLKFYTQLLQIEKSMESRDFLTAFLNAFECFRREELPEDDLEIDLYMAFYKKQKRDQREDAVRKQLGLIDLDTQDDKND